MSVRIDILSQGNQKKEKSDDEFIPIIIDHFNLVNGGKPQKNKESIEEVLDLLTELRREKNIITINVRRNY